MEGFVWGGRSTVPAQRSNCIPLSQAFLGSRSFEAWKIWQRFPRRRRKANGVDLPSHADCNKLSRSAWQLCSLWALYVLLWESWSSVMRCPLLRRQVLCLLCASFLFWALFKNYVQMFSFGSWVPEPLLLYSPQWGQALAEIGVFKIRFCLSPTIFYFVHYIACLWRNFCLEF